MTALFILCPHCKALSPIHNAPTPFPGVAYGFTCPKQGRGCGKSSLAPIPYYDEPLKRVYVAAWKPTDAIAIAFGKEDADHQALFNTHVFTGKIFDEELWVIPKPEVGAHLYGNFLRCLAYATRTGICWPHPQPPQMSLHS
jgi:hypothetical protein